MEREVDQRKEKMASVLLHDECRKKKKKRRDLAEEKGNLRLAFPNGIHRATRGRKGESRRRHSGATTVERIHEGRGEHERGGERGGKTTKAPGHALR